MIAFLSEKKIMIQKIDIWQYFLENFKYDLPLFPVQKFQTIVENFFKKL